MPTYQYVCTECGEDIEVVQKFSDAALTTHDACGGKLRKVFSPVGIVFKGSGFYRTDSRSGSSVSSSSNGEKSSSSASDGATKPDTSDKSDKSAASSNGDSKKSDTGSSSSSSTSSTTKVA